MDYLLQVAVLIGIYAILALSLDLLVGHAGVLSLAHAAFYGIGAYTAVLVSRWAPGSFPTQALCAILVTSLLGSLVMSPTHRTRGEQLVLAIFAVQVILSSVMMNWTGLTHGPLGLSITRRASGFEWTGLRLQLFGLTLPSVLIGWLVVSMLATGSYGRALHAMREDAIFAETRGRDVRRYRREIVLVSCGLAGLAGALYAQVIGFVDPTAFSVSESLLILSMVIIGGAGSTSGAILGAGTLILLGEALRSIGLPNSVAANIRQIIYGAVLIGVLLVRPRGMVGRFGFGR